MNPWSDPTFLYYQITSFIGCLPMTVVELAIGIWALRVLRERPRAARLMFGFVALLLFNQFGIARIMELLYAAGGSFGGLTLSVIGQLGFYLGYGLALATTVAIWWVAIPAVFGREEHELDLASHDEQPSGERP
jgi:hypothetical protein